MILNKTVTLYRHTGEDSSHKAVYDIYTLQNVYYTDTTAVVRADTAPAGVLVLYAFDAKSTVRDASGRRVTEWTAREEDIIVPGEHGAVEKPATLEGARKVISCARLKAGSRRMWHRKVVAK